MIVNPNGGNSPRVEVATPIIDVSASGLITATTKQEKGYVSGGTKSATQQLTTQGAKTVTPTTTNQTAVASGRYTTGNVVVAGDANLVPENIAEGVSIFGVMGTLAGGGGIEWIPFPSITQQSSRSQVLETNQPILRAPPAAVYTEVKIPVNDDIRAVILVHSRGFIDWPPLMHIVYVNGDPYYGSFSNGAVIRGLDFPFAGDSDGTGSTTIINNNELPFYVVDGIQDDCYYALLKW